MWGWFVDTFGPLLALLGSLALGGSVITALAFGLFKAFGENWLSNRFAERLAAFRHDQAKELEQVKFEIGKLMDRTTKLHQREFEILPKAWSRMAKSYYCTGRVIASFQSYPDVERMNPAQLDEFLEDSRLQNWQKAELKNTQRGMAGIVEGDRARCDACCSQ